MVATMKLLFALTTKIAVSAHSARTSDANPVDLLAANSLAYETITLLQQNNRYPLHERTNTKTGDASDGLYHGTGVGHGGKGGNGGHDTLHYGNGVGKGGHGGHGGTGDGYMDGGFSSPVVTTTLSPDIINSGITATCPALCPQSLDPDNCPIIPYPFQESCKSHTSQCLATKLKGEHGCSIAKQFLVCCGKQYCVCSRDKNACETAVKNAAEYTGPVCSGATRRVPISAEVMANAFCGELQTSLTYAGLMPTPGLLQLKESEIQLQLKARAKQLGAVEEEPLEETLCDKCMDEL